MPAPRQAALLQPEHEHDLEAARARAQEVEHRDAPGFARRERAHLGALERGDDLLGVTACRRARSSRELGDAGA